MANYTLTNVAKSIAVKDEVVRADVAALLIVELRLEKLMAGRIPNYSAEKKQVSFVPADVTKHIFKSEILTVMGTGLRGLEPQYDKTTKAYLFNPDKPLDRKGLAFILEDLVVKISGDESLSTAFFGQKRSPYPDVSPSSSWFNAVMNAVTRGLMETELTGAFRPEEVADGAELILAVMRLRNVMNIH